MSEEFSIFSVNGVQNLVLTSGVQTSQAPKGTIYILYIYIYIYIYITYLVYIQYIYIYIYIYI